MSGKPTHSYPRRYCRHEQFQVEICGARTFSLQSWSELSQNDHQVVGALLFYLYSAIAGCALTKVTGFDKKWAI